MINANGISSEHWEHQCRRREAHLEASIRFSTPIKLQIQLSKPVQKMFPRHRKIRCPNTSKTGLVDSQKCLLSHRVLWGTNTAVSSLHFALFEKTFFYETLFSVPEFCFPFSNLSLAEPGMMILVDDDNNEWHFRLPFGRKNDFSGWW